MNILELNTELANTLRDLKDGKIDTQQANSIVNIANAMTNNAKILLQAAKIAKNESVAALVIGNDKVKELQHEDAYTARTEFALKLGYKNLSEAMGEMGRAHFERRFKERNN